MQPRLRSPLATWLMAAVTGGIYLPFWAWNVATELNYAEGQTVFHVNAWRLAFGVLLVAYIAGFVVATETDRIWPVMTAGFALLGLYIHVQLAIGNYIKRKDQELSTWGSYSHIISLLLLWMFALYGVAYIQQSLNRIIRRSRARL